MRGFLLASSLLVPVAAFGQTVTQSPVLSPTGNGSQLSGLVTINARAPTLLDDTAHGFSIGNIWQSPQGAFTAQQVAANHAVWTQTSVSGYPIDAVGGTAPIAAYGTRLLAIGYAGKAFNVVRASDSTAKDIGFLAGGALDTATLDQFCANTTCTVATWYDQSGNANNAVQATAANRPSVYAPSLSGNARSIVFDTQQDAVTYVQKYMTLPAGVAATGNAMSAFFAGRQYSSEKPSFWAQFTNATYPVSFASALNGYSPPNNLNMFYGSSYTSGANAGQTAGVFGFVSGTGANGIVVWSGDKSTSYTGQAANAMAGGYLGASAAGLTSNVSGYTEMGAVLIYGRALSAATEVPAIRMSLAQSFNLAPQIRDVIAIDGDSITEGYGSTFLQNRPRQLAALLSRPALVYDKGYYGTLLATRVTNYAADVAPLYNASATNNLLEIFAGTNDNDGTNTAGTAIYTNLTSYVTAAHSTGWKVLVGTMLPRNGWSANQTTEQLAFNVLVRANAAGADAVIDYAADPTMGNASNVTNTLYYIDGVHPTTLGYGYLAQIEAASFNSLSK